MRTTIVLLVAVALFVAPAWLRAQEIPDSKGTDFWFALMPNFHNGYDSLEFREDLKLQHELYIYIGADQPTSGTITLKDIVGAERVVPFTITDPKQLFEFRTFIKPYELIGWNRSGRIDYAGMQTETIAEQSIHITSAADVTVYALNEAVTTSEAFLVLPTDALAEDYMVASYTSDIDWFSEFNKLPENTSTPSQFCVVATEDGTTITINPSEATFLSPNLEPQSITLNRGQVYMVQVDPRVKTTADLTGSLIRSSKPVAVFGGHQRALVPIEDQLFLGSRDCLIEQMNPIRTWGKSAFIFPLALSSNEVTNSTSRFRVMAAFDSTKVYIDEVEIAELQRGKFYEGILDHATEVRSSRPVMVSMLKKTAGPGAGVATRIGDPFMMLVPPAEQFMNRYRFVNVQAHEYSIFNGFPVQGDPVYTEQWLSVVMPTGNVSSLILDGSPVAPGAFAPIGTTGYSWGQFRMQDGIHEITADTNFGIYVYGYGVANSYGYIGGMAFRPLDVQPPTIFGSPNCGVFRGAMADSVLGDSRIKEARVLPGSERNVSVSLDVFKPPVAVVEFTATLVNPFQDGSFAVEATDHVRQVSSATFDVPGFTIGAVGQGPGTTLAEQMRVIPIRQQRCDTVSLENYGAFPHTITRLQTTMGALVTDPPLPVVLAPGERVDVVMCRLIASAGIYEDTLFITDSCTPRPTHRLISDVRADEEAPYDTVTSIDCSPEYVLTIGDDRDFDYGIMSTEIMDSVLTNCTVELLDERVPIHRYRVTVTDPLFDAIYGIHAVDSASNESWNVDTIPGFTLAFDADGGYFQSRTLTEASIGDISCDTVWLTNYGNFPQHVQSVYVRGNVLFSVPSNQLPLTVAPGSRVPLIVCYEPRQVIEEMVDMDTLEFTDGCLVKQLELVNNGTTVTYDGLSRCNALLASNVHSAGIRLSTAPQPAQDVLYLQTSRQTTTLNVQVLDVQGALVLRRSWKGTPTTTFQLDLTTLVSGSYLVVAQLDQGTETSMIQVR